MDHEFKLETAFRRKHNYLYELGVDKNILDKTQKTHNQKGKKKNFIKIKHFWLLKSLWLLYKKIYRQSTDRRKMQVIHTSDKELTSL